MLFLYPPLTAYLLFLTAALGLAAGSFINCLAWRLARGQSAAAGRSRCAVCGHTLGAAELIPVISYLRQGGRCRWCGEVISPRYPAAELVSMLVFLAVVLRYDITFIALRALVLCCLLLTVALIDLDVRLIPDRLWIAAAVWYLMTLPLVARDIPAALWSGVKGGLFVALPLLFFVLLADKVVGRETMGGGDLKLFFAVGLYLGAPLNLLNLITSCLLGVIFGIADRLRRGDGESRPIPFGPSVAAGTFLTLLFGQGVLDWYLSLFI